MMNDILDFLGGLFTAILAGFFGGLDGLLMVLLVMIVLDYITGNAKAWIRNEISSEVGFKGIFKKCLILTFVGIAHLLDTVVPADGGAIRAVVCTFYIANEGKSIIENAHALGVPIPEALLSHFTFMDKSDKKDERPGEMKESGSVDLNKAI